MTGQKNRFKTTERLWDLDDKQLKTPTHDAMVLWMMDEDNLLNYWKIFELPTRFEYNEYLNHKIGYKEVPHSFMGLHVDSEQPIMSSPTFIAGYADLIVTPVYAYRFEDIKGVMECDRHSCLIEIKPYIDSFGAVLRQVKSYEKFWKKTSWTKKLAIFTFDDRFDAQFKSQGIEVLHPPEDMSVEDMIEMYGLR